MNAGSRMYTEASTTLATKLKQVGTSAARGVLSCREHDASGSGFLTLGIIEPERKD